MKIKLPNPDDFTGDIDGFFDQLELSVYHARKSWENIKAKYTETDLENEHVSPYLLFRIPCIDENYDKYAVDIIDQHKHQEIDIEISEV